ncbi:MAG: hypothetical protein JSW65_03890 [Candidatus Bipolaricaulota bacterium]|nr:MAG: hypothetical protein JSW65_03890 [Candidatus Bipolaricaulota bacterium]
MLGTLHLLFCIGMILLFLGGGLEHAIDLCEIVPGMTEGQVIAAWREPDSTTELTIEASDGEDGHRSLWVYEKRGQTVVFEDGVVVRCEQQ